MIKSLAYYNLCRLINSEELRRDCSKCHAKLHTDRIHLRAITVVGLNVKYLPSFGPLFYQMTMIDAYKEQHQQIGLIKTFVQISPKVSYNL